MTSAPESTDDEVAVSPTQMFERRASVGAVIVTHSRPELARRCVQSLLGQVDAGNIVVVANLPETGNALDEVLALGCTLLVNRSIAGYGENLNRGVEATATGCQYLLLLNDDVVVAANAVATLIDELERDAAVGLAGPRVIDELGHDAAHTFRFPSLGSTVLAGLLLPGSVARRLPARWYGMAGPGDADWLLGAALLVRRQAWDSIGGFDPGFFLNSEEVDFARRLRNARWAIRSVPQATVTHLGHASLTSRLLEDTLAPSRSRYIALHWGRWRRSMLPVVVKLCRSWNRALVGVAGVVAPRRRTGLELWARAKESQLPVPELVRQHRQALTDPASNRRPPSRIMSCAASLVETDVVPLLRRALAVNGSFRPATAAAFRLGAFLGRQAPAYVGQLPTGSRIVLDLGEFAHRRIYFYGTYEEPTTALVRRLARPGWTFMDVGANAGYFTLLAADLGGPASTIVAFEPNPALAAMLTRSVEVNGGRQSAPIKIVTAGCSDRTGRATLALSPERGNSGLSSLEPVVAESWQASAAAAEVETVRLDAWCAEHGVVPDVVKVDVEGHELAVIDGMRDLLDAGHPRALICEVATDPRRIEKSTAVVERLVSFGYQPFHILETGDLEAFNRPSQLRSFENVCFLSPDADLNIGARFDVDLSEHWS